MLTRTVGAHTQTVCMSCATRTSLSHTLTYPYLRTPPDCVYVLQKKHVVIKGGHIIYNADILRPKSVLRHDINPSLLHKLNMLDLPRLLARRGP